MNTSRNILQLANALFRRSVAVLLLIVLSPIIFITILAIIVDDGFPILFRQKRIGEDNTYFSIYKFRTMKNSTPDLATHLMNNHTDYFTRIGRVLRKTSIDELPQLINIIKGEMVFIGPRPALYNQDDLIEQRTFIGVHKLRPGITGWAQVNGRDELSISDKVKCDTFYLNNQSVNLDLRILALTMIKVLKKNNVSH
jgi:O-antigen biosynthesis protein WbqP